MPVLYYAVGGGLGHLTRARAILHALGLQQQAVLLTASPHAADPRVIGEIPVLLAPNDERSYRAWFPDQMARLAPERIIVDTFPAGLFGEIEAARVDYVARYLRWDKYAPRDLPQFDRTWVLEELEAEHQRVIDARSSEVIRDFKLEDPPPCDRSTPPLPQSFVLVVHSGPPGEIAELMAYARDVCSIEGAGGPIVLCAPREMHRSDVEAISDWRVASREQESGRSSRSPLASRYSVVDVYPATLIAKDAVRIFTGGGYNAMRQFGGDPRHRPLPFPRLFDDQYRRVAVARSALQRFAS